MNMKIKSGYNINYSFPFEIQEVVNYNPDHTEYFLADKERCEKMLKHLSNKLLYSNQKLKPKIRAKIKGSTKKLNRILNDNAEYFILGSL